MCAIKEIVGKLSIDLYKYNRPFEQVYIYIYIYIYSYRNDNDWSNMLSSEYGWLNNEPLTIQFMIYHM